MKKQTKEEQADAIFARFFYFFSNNGYTNVMYPESWDKKEERRKINEQEEKKQKYRN